MQRFTQLFVELDRTTRTTEKLASLKHYFSEAPPEDAAWALFFLSGQRLPRPVKTTDLRQWVADARSLPLWLVEESYDAVGDLGETLALLAPTADHPFDIPLHAIVEERLRPLKAMSDEEKHAVVTRTWRELNTEQCLVYHKLIMGEFRIGVSRTLVVRALAEVAGIEPADMAHRLMGTWQPTAADFSGMLHGQAKDISRPYPFYLAYPLESALESLGAIEEWQAEWKWDGIRAQLIKREDQVLLWSRGEELITDRFPEITDAAKALPNGTVLDGEVLAWMNEKPLPFGDLQRRIGRKNVDKKIRAEVPVVMMLYDIMEVNGEDIRGKAIESRRRILEALLEKSNEPMPFILSPVVEASSWEDLTSQRTNSRTNLVEGLMLKRKSSAYGVGRTKGDWWKWKIDPLTIDAVLIYAQQGHGRRASLFTDYTFGVWGDPDASGERKLVPVAKAYSGLTDEEIKKVDQFVRQNTLDKFGPVRVVKPELVFELAFEGIQKSTRHKAGIAVRFPRMARWREDKPIEEADSLDTLRSLLKSLTQ
ncbi:MAG TPA: ATP-dependent DNA ligase [Candidatus Kapabacteria bacterium]|nr:ATP-dependent DNA ligase [Candidatus Kapabacteria bacterium]